MRIVTDFNGLTYYEVDFNSDGTLDTAGGGGDGGLPAAVTAGGISDLFVFSHGWNSGVDSARDLYQAMFGLLANQLGGHLSSSAAVGSSGPRCCFPTTTPSPHRRCRRPARSWPLRSHRASRASSSSWPPWVSCSTSNPKMRPN